jgi:hypothetical protein
MKKPASGRPWRIDLNSCGQSSSGDIDAVIAALAGRQHGRVARWQLLELGLSARVIDHRVARFRLLPEYPGVYGLGHAAPSREGRWMAAVLLGGPGAVLSHWAAASNWGMARSAPSRIDVTAANRREHRRGVRFHRSNLPHDEVTLHKGIPITIPARTLFDIAADLALARGATRPPRRLEGALNQGDALRLWEGPSLVALMERHPRRAGSRAVRLALRWRAAGATVTRSEFEDGFVEFVDGLGLRRPEINATLMLDGCQIEVDALWRTERVAVELDGRQFHNTPAAFEADRLRDRRLSAAGWRPVRITWRQLHVEPAGVARDLKRILAVAA